MLDDQQKLLPYVDAAGIEYFGLHPRRESLSLEKDAIPCIGIIQKNPDKVFLVFWRGLWRYSDYKEDYLLQRFLYYSYLLAAGPNTLFKYHASFQVPSHAGRSGGMDVYADWKLSLGEPLGAYQRRRGLYLRRFTKGLSTWT
jgi:hypothetical protein